MDLERVIKWGLSQTRISDVPPYTPLSESFSALTPEQRKTLIEYDYPPKRGKVVGSLIDSDYAHLWCGLTLLADGQWHTPPELLFLQKKIEQLSFFPYLHRIVVHSFETGGWIRPHVDLPIMYQIIIPLVQDDGFHFVWEDWGRVKFETYRAYRVAIHRTHAVWNTGNKRIMLNMLAGKFDPGISLLEIE